MCGLGGVGDGWNRGRSGALLGRDEARLRAPGRACLGAPGRCNTCGHRRAVNGQWGIGCVALVLRPPRLQVGTARRRQELEKTGRRSQTGRG